jgi:hypothetical protein
MKKLSILLLSVFLLLIAAGCREESVKKPESGTASQTPLTSGTPSKETTQESAKDKPAQKADASLPQTPDLSDKSQQPGSQDNRPQAVPSSSVVTSSQQAAQKPASTSSGNQPAQSATPAAPDKTTVRPAAPAVSATSSPNSSTASPDQNKRQKMRLEQIVHYNNGESFWAFGHGALYFSDNNGKQWADMTPKGVSINAAGSGFDLFAFHQGTGQIDVYEHSFDPQQEWTRSVLPTKEKWEVTGNLMFANYLVGDDNWLLIDSASTEGSDMKVLYRISWDEKQWTRVRDISDQIVGKPSGVTIRNSKEGWIACSGGNNDIILYHTADGGLQWAKEKLPVPEDISKASFIADVYAPVFDEESDARLILPVEFIQGAEHIMTYYTTRDAGKNWSLSSSRLKNVKHPPVFYPDPTYGKGTALAVQGDTLYHFALDDYSLIFGGPVPSPLTIKLKTNLSKATQLFFRTEINEDNQVQRRGWALLDGELVIAQADGTEWQRQ